MLFISITLKYFMIRNKMKFEFSINFISIKAFKNFNHACAQIWSVNRTLPPSLPPTNTLIILINKINRNDTTSQLSMHIPLCVG
jgi:hypothetical protein